MHKEIPGIILLGFIIWVAIATDGNARIARFCSPIGWLGNLTVSATAMTVPSYQEGMGLWFQKFDYGCRYSLWRLFYQAEWNSAVAAQQQAEGAAAQAAASEAASAPATASGVAASIPSGAAQ